MAKVAIVNPFPAKRKNLAARKRPVSKVDLWKTNTNPVAPMTKSTVLALNDQSYKAGLLAGRKRSGASGRRKNRNPIGVNDVMDMAADAGMGAAGAIAVDLAAGFIFPKIGLVQGSNAMVYAAAKGVMAVAAGELFADMSKGASYKLATGSLTCTLHDMAKTWLAPKMPAGMTLGRLRGLPNLPDGRYTAPAPVIPAMLGRGNITVAGGNRNNMPRIQRPRGLSL